MGETEAPHLRDTLIGRNSEPVCTVGRVCFRVRCEAPHRHPLAPLVRVFAHTAHYRTPPRPTPWRFRLAQRVTNPVHVTLIIGGMQTLVAKNVVSRHSRPSSSLVRMSRIAIHETEAVGLSRDLRLVDAQISGAALA